MKKINTSRRKALKQISLLGAAGTVSTLGLSAQPSTQNRITQSSREGFLAELRQRVNSTPMVDSHEHLQDERDRLRNNKNCIRLFQHYLGDDFASAGLNSDSVFGKEAENAEPVVLWRRLEPFWNAVKNTGYGQAFRITVNELYGIEKIEESVIPQFQQAFEKLSVRRKPNCCRITFSGFVSNWPMNIIYRSNSIWDIMPEVIGCLFHVSRKMLRRLPICVFSPPKPGLCLCTRRIPTVTI